MTEGVPKKVTCKNFRALSMANTSQQDAKTPSKVSDLTFQSISFFNHESIRKKRA